MVKFRALALAAGLAAISVPGLVAAQAKGAKGGAATAPSKTMASAPAASSAGGVGQGDFELGIFAALQSPKEGDDSTLIGGNLGYYLRDNIPLGVSVFYFDTQGVSGGIVGFGADYQFAHWQPAALSNPLVPYVGASYDLAIGDLDDTDFYELRAGIKQFIGERISVDYEVEQLNAVDTDFDDFNSTNFLVELSFYF